MREGKVPTSDANRFKMHGIIERKVWEYRAHWRKEPQYIIISKVWYDWAIEQHKKQMAKIGEDQMAEPSFIPEKYMGVNLAFVHVIDDFFIQVV